MNRIASNSRLGRAALALTLAMAAAGCANFLQQERHTSASVVDFLYPDTRAPVVEPGTPELRLPLRVGIAFVPSTAASPSLTQTRERELLQRVADHFKQYDFVKSIEVIPSDYLRPHGSFANLEQIRTLYGVDVVALVSYDQVQFTDQGALSLTYWTIVGAYVIPANKNDTQTLLDTVVMDVGSRKMLFRAPGTDRVTGRATLVNASEQLRIDSAASFDAAGGRMIDNLDQELARFKEKVKQSPADYHVVRAPGYSGGAGGGSMDVAWLGVLALAAVAALARRT
jgi:rhombotail lipoprotein